MFIIFTQQMEEKNVSVVKCKELFEKLFISIWRARCTFKIQTSGYKSLVQMPEILN